MSRELKTTMRSWLFLLVLPVLLVLGAPAFARETLDSILPQIRAAHPGRLSDAEPFVDNDGSTHYRIKWMTPEGRILYFDADTRSGRYRNYGGDDGGQWRGGGDHSWHGDGGQQDEGGDSRHHDNWNGSGAGNSGDGGGYWGARRGGEDDRGRRDGGGGHGGDWGGGHGGDWGGGRAGDWRGGHGGGDNGGHHHGGH
jgi:hypothetical protein